MIVELQPIVHPPDPVKIRGDCALKSTVKSDVCGLLTVEIFFFFFFSLWPHLRHMKVPRLGVTSELQLPAYTTATAMWDPGYICDLHHSSQQCQILNHWMWPGIEPMSS